MPHRRRAASICALVLLTALSALAAAAGEIRVRAGAIVRASPAAKAKALGAIEQETTLEDLGRQGSWVKVRFAGKVGWIRLTAVADSLGGAPPLGAAAEPTHPVPARAPDPERLALARKLLGGKPREATLGPYLLWTDLPPSERIDLLARVAGNVDPIYRARFGREPIGAPAETVVLFATEETYRRFLDSEAALAGAQASGHSGFGIVAIWDGGRPVREIAETLIHEIVHLLDRRAIGPQLPPWLDEGLADDLAHASIGNDGAIDPARLGGASFRAGARIQYFGARAAHRQLAEAIAAGSAPPLAQLLALPWERFVGDNGDLHYAQAAFFVRYLIAGDDGQLAPGFRAFLAAIAGGGEPSQAALEAALGRPLEEVEVRFRDWVPQQQD